MSDMESVKKSLLVSESQFDFALLKDLKHLSNKTRLNSLQANAGYKLPRRAILPPPTVASVL